MLITVNPSKKLISSLLSIYFRILLEIEGTNVKFIRLVDMIIYTGRNFKYQYRDDTLIEYRMIFSFSKLHPLSNSDILNLLQYTHPLLIIAKCHPSAMRQNH